MLQASALTERLVLICNTYRDRERELAYIAHFRAQRVKALVLAGSGLEDPDFGARMAAQINAFEATGGRAVLIRPHYAPPYALLPHNLPRSPPARRVPGSGALVLGWSRGAGAPEWAGRRGYSRFRGGAAAGGGARSWSCPRAPLRPSPAGAPRDGAPLWGPSGLRKGGRHP